MANELQHYLMWTFTNEVDVPEDVESLLVPGERPVCAYSTIRDIAIFTDRRLIVRDVQGITGKKVEMYTLPYKSIDMYSTENAGHLDVNSEVELWTRAGHIKINLKRSADVRKIDKILAAFILK